MTKSMTQRVVLNLRDQGFTVLTRPEWGSVHEDTYAARRRLKPVTFPQDILMQHITVTLDHGPLTGDFKADVRTVEEIGFERFGSGISYNWVVDMETGMIAVGQPLDAAGTHTVNDKRVPGYPMPPRSLNYSAFAIAVLGMPSTVLEKPAKRALVGLGVAMVQEGALTRDYEYLPHSKFAVKDCPCESTRSQMGKIRTRVSARLTDKKWVPGPTGPR